MQCAESLIAQFDAALNYERDDDIQKGMLITDMKTLKNFLLITGIVGAGLAYSFSGAAAKVETVQPQAAASSEFVEPNEGASGESAQMREANSILEAAARQMKMNKKDFQKNLVAARFSPEQNVFIPSALAIDFQKKTVTLPVYKGTGPSGQPTYYIITEAADFKIAKMMGVNYAPKLAHGKDTDGIQKVTMENGMIKFAGDVDFKPERIVVPGKFPKTIPPATAQPGSVGDANYSPLVQLPNGLILNTPIVANSTGNHDHLVNIDYDKGTVEFELLDGFQGGQQYYYHLVTESNDKVAATIERGTYTPKLGKLPAFGKDELKDKSTLLAFAPTANGETGKDNPERQGLNSTVLDGNKYDPVNVFPIDPENNKKDNNNYSPMWDAHIYVWSDAAIKAGKRERIQSFEELEQMKKAGHIGDAPMNMGVTNSFAGGLKPSNAIINCPVIAQPTNP